MDEETRTWIIEKQDKKEDELQSIEMWVVVHTKWGGYTENEIRFKENNDSTFIISDDSSYIYLYPEQVEQLRKMLNHE